MPAPPPAERKLVTVLFADLVGHTEILTRVDPEEWQDLLHAYFAEMTQRIERYGGTVEKHIGDAIFAVFGVPRTHEDDAERAVRAAVEMRDALERLNLAFTRRLGAALEARIAVATGDVVTPGEGQLVTSDLAALAERLQRQAPGNGIILSERTHRLIAPLVDVEPLGPLALKGFPDDHPAVLVLRLRSPVEKMRGMDVSAPLVGREHEVKVLMSARERLLAGQGQVMVIVGEAGLGKSRLVAELRSRLGTEIALVEARCHEFTQAIAYSVVVQHLRHYLEFAENDPPEVGRVQLGAALHRTFRSSTADVQQALEYVLGLDVSHESSGGIRGLAPDEARSRVVRAILAFWEAVAGKKPLVMVVEDLHWIDSASVGVLQQFLQVTERVPLMLLCAFRPERQSLAWEFKVAADREYPHRYREVRLGPLTAEDTEQLAGLLLEKVGSSIELKSKVAQRAEGNPFYVEEIVRSLHDHGGEAVTLARLPDTLHGILQARLDGLPRETRGVLQTASVIGRTFPLRLLAAASGIQGDLNPHLSTLQRTEFLSEQQRLPEPQFAFKHVLLQEAAYQTLLRDERREFHRRVAAALERESPGGAELPILVHHFLHGEEWGKAFAYAIKAAEAAWTLSALDVALEQYDIALSMAREHPESVPDKGALFRAQKGRGDALVFLGRSQDAHRHFETLLKQHRQSEIRAQIYRSIGRVNSDFTGNLRKAQANLEKALRLLDKCHDPAAQAATYRDLAIILERRRAYSRAREYAQRALATAQEHGLQAQLKDIYLCLAVTHFFAGDPSQSVRYAEQSLSYALQSKDQRAIVLSQNNIAHLLLFMGHVKGALRHADEALALATRIGIGDALAIVHVTLAEIYLEQGRWEAAADALEAMDVVVRRHTLGAVWQARVYREQGFVALARGMWDEAIKHLREAKSLVEQTGIARYLPKIHRGLAEAYLGRRDFRRAHSHASKVRSYEQSGSLIETPGALRVLAAIARKRGDLDLARTLLEESRSLLQIRRASGEYARVLLELTRTLAAAGQPVEARTAAEEAIEIYVALDAPPLVEATRRVVRELKLGGDHDGDENAVHERAGNSDLVLG